MLIGYLAGAIRFAFVERFDCRLLIESVLHTLRGRSRGCHQTVGCALLHKVNNLPERAARIVSHADFGQLLSQGETALWKVLVDLRLQRLQTHQQHSRISLSQICLTLRSVDSASPRV